jgi:glycosyltransferase involved in cell wall biosynthesis
MNILVLTDEIYPDGVSGIGKSVYNECVALAQRGHNVTVVVRALGGALPQHALVEGVSVHRFAGPARAHPLYHLYPLVILLSLTRWLLGHRTAFDVVYSFNPLYILPAWWTGTLRQRALVHSFYSSIADEIRINADRGKYARRRWLGHLAAAVLGAQERFALGKVDGFLARSVYTRDTLRRVFPPAKILAVLPTGVDIGIYTRRDPHEARSALGLPLDRPILITVRRLEGRMGLHQLMHAMQIVRQTHPSALLLIAGKGYLRPELEQLSADLQITEQVRFLGFVSESDLPVVLSAADAFVLPTEMLEGFGLATVESMAAGTPAIGTPVGATPELLSPLDARLITRDSSPGALAEAIADWLDRPEDLAALRSRVRAEVETKYSADGVAAALESLFAEMAAQRTQREVSR